jgi:hypothetical protein
MHNIVLQIKILTFEEFGYVGVVLELEEASLHHVLGIHLLHPKQVEHHVVGQPGLRSKCFA